jgi:hypothetical protein
MLTLLIQVKAYITAILTTLNNTSDVQANYAEIYDKAFKDIQLQTKTYCT